MRAVCCFAIQRRRERLSGDDADYIKIHEQNPDEAFAFWDYGTELSRRFRALKIWLTLRYYGLRNALRLQSAKITRWQQYLAQCVDSAKDFEMLAPVELSICCFRYLPREFQSRLNVFGERGPRSAGQ